MERNVDQFEFQLKIPNAQRWLMMEWEDHLLESHEYWNFWRRLIVVKNRRSLDRVYTELAKLYRLRNVFILDRLPTNGPNLGRRNVDLLNSHQIISSTKPCKSRRGSRMNLRT